MTVEVAVLNCLAIAMAADSAQTVGPEWGQKVFASADKIFALSSVDPVGIMVFGNADLLELPWETIVKEYRKTRGHASLPTVDAHAKAFLEFISEESLFPAAFQDEQYIEFVAGYFRFVREQVREMAERTLKDRGQVTDKEVGAIVKTVVARHHELWEQQETLQNIPDGFGAAIRRKHKSHVRRSITEIFEKLPMTDETLSQLADLAVNLVLKWPPGSITPPRVSGLVIAGFGQRELFPVLRTFEVLTVVGGIAIHRRHASKCVDISHDMTGAVVAFAQEDVVCTFMEGAAPRYKQMVDTLLRELVVQVPSEVLDGIPSLAASEREQLKARLSQEEVGRVGQYLKRLVEFRRREYINPILEVVSVLPKDELASMAEALASLTSLKRRLTMGERETVGGPVDVAVVSKGDGLVWIKRKHYFRRELNPHFFTRYGREGRDDQEPSKE
jgi:hypothetical protein